MVHWGWLPIAASIGCIFGFVMGCLVSVSGRAAEQEEMREELQRAYEQMEAQHGAQG